MEINGSSANKWLQIGVITGRSIFGELFDLVGFAAAPFYKGTNRFFIISASSSPFFFALHNRLAHSRLAHSRAPVEQRDQRCLCLGLDLSQA